ncbi:MAG: integrase core domain-containing protein [Planctomycetes bacterium]|nr:integrase core domain-containing protein [Planctomycetota bacterium]MCH9775065.1 integrase core domain-containing protein [Planctomycetota bacterium]MCH9789430.1 integrase core domain-containing protein [Planctomycetota bacterium]
MKFILQPWQFLFVLLCGWVHQRQSEIIEFQNAQITALLEKLGKKRILLTDNQRRVLAVKSKSIGRKTLMELTTIVTPDTLLRWHHDLVAKKWDYSEKRKSVGRPHIRQVIVDLILKFAKENPTWGYNRIQGALANVGYKISDTTVGNILKAHGIEPAPNRQCSGSWSTFLKSHWDVLAAIDFTTVEVWTKHGLVTFYLLFAMELKTRRVHFTACSPGLGDEYMRNIAVGLTDEIDGFLKEKKYVIMDRDANFSSAFRRRLEICDVQPVRLPPKSPNLNAYMERFHLSIKSECLDRMIFFGERSLRRAVDEYISHYHEERNHQGLQNELIEPVDGIGSQAGKIECRERLGGLLKYYYRNAA